jgi:hypothetical protein
MIQESSDLSLIKEQSSNQAKFNQESVIVEIKENKKKKKNRDQGQD